MFAPRFVTLMLRRSFLLARPQGGMAYLGPDRPRPHLPLTLGTSHLAFLSGCRTKGTVCVTPPYGYLAQSSPPSVPHCPGAHGPSLKLFLKLSFEA